MARLLCATTSRKRCHSPDLADTPAGIILDLATADMDPLHKLARIDDVFMDVVDDVTMSEVVDVEMTLDVGASTKEERFRAVKSEYLKRSRLEAGTRPDIDYSREVLHCMTLVSDSLLDFGINIGDWRGELRRLGETKPGQPRVTPQYCQVCKVALSGPKPMEAHLKGRAHLKNAARQTVCPQPVIADTKDRFQAMVQRSTSTSAEIIHLHDEMYKCQICNINISGTLNREQHINGRQHQKKLVRQKDESAASSEADSNSFYCELCNVNVNGEQPIRDHLAGAKHNRKLKRRTD